MGKPKKGKKKANDDWEDDVLNELESLKDGDEADKKDQPAPPQKASRFQALEDEGANYEDNDEDDLPMDTSAGKTTKKEKKKKLDKLNDTDEIYELPTKDDTVENGNTKLEAETDLVEDDFEMALSSKKTKKGKKSKKDVDVSEIDMKDDLTESSKIETSKPSNNDQDLNDKDAGMDDNEDDGPIIKTTAQKKAEKKEREKKKKALEKERKQKAAKKTDKTEEGAEEDKDLKRPAEHNVEESVKKTESLKTEPPQPSEDTAENAEGETITKEQAEAGEGDEEGEGDKKKKKKKKKKKAAEEEETKKVKKPNKALVKQMQQQLEQLRLEEEKQRQAEEEKIRLREEAEERRLEKIRLEQERKDKRKQKEKERKARLKQEGKLLTKAQKEQKAKQQAMLEAMKLQGIEIPGLKAEDQDTVRKPVRYGTRKKKPQQQQQQQQQQDKQEPEDVVDVEMTIEDQAKVETEKPTVETPEESKTEQEKLAIEQAKDAWDLESDEEESSNPAGKEGEMAAEPVKERKKSDGSSADNEDDGESSSDSEEEEDDEDEEESDSSEDEEESEDESKTQSVAERINKRRTRAELNRTADKLRSPIICVLGHVDTGKTKILDKIRHTHVQDGEAGGITQQIGATMVPVDAIRTQTRMVKEFQDFDIKLPGLLIIDTPGHESFSNLRSRGSSLCDMAILVVDIMHALEPQTIESINLLKKKKTPFVVALNKVDRLFEWKRGPDSSIINTIKKQKRNTKQEFDERVAIAMKEFAEQGLNACLFYDNKDTRSYVSMIPTSAHSGDGMGDLISQIVRLTQTRLTQRLSYSEELEGMILEVKALPGLGTTIDVILVNGTLREGDTIIVPGIDGPIVTQIRALLTPQPMKELRVKSNYINHKEICGAQGVKIAAKDLDKALAGIPMMVAQREDEIEYCKQEVASALSDVLKSIHLSDRGVYVQASTLGSLEALLEFLKVSKIPYSGVNIGPVHKKDVMKCSTMLEHDVQFAVILAFDVKIERESQEMADSLGVTIFSADIIYHLFDKFTSHREKEKLKKREEFRHIAVFPCKLRILPDHVYNSRDPIVVGVLVESGVLRENTPVCVPGKNFVDIGVVTGIEANHKSLEEARKGMEVCIKIEPTPGDTPKLYGRHFDHEDIVTSKISRQSIDAVKDYFRDDLQKSDWQLMIELKKLFQIL